MDSIQTSVSKKCAKPVVDGINVAFLFRQMVRIRPILFTNKQPLIFTFDTFFHEYLNVTNHLCDETS